MSTWTITNVPHRRVSAVAGLADPAPELCPCKPTVVVVHVDQGGDHAEP